VTSAKALVLESPRYLKFHEFDIPEVNDDDAVLSVEACGLCGTDHEQYSGAFPASFAFIPGHETIGRVMSIGKNAAQLWEVSEGDLVALEVFQTCRACDFCKSGDYRRCKSHGLKDMYGFVSITKEPGLWGGYATHQYLAPSSIVHKVPDNLDPVLATLFNPLGAGIRWAWKLPGTKAGDYVAILGPGIRGISSVIAAKEAGAQFICVTGVGERDAPRLQLAKKCGADLVIDVAKENPAASIKAATGGRLADVVVDVTAKAPKALAQAIEMAETGGTVVLAGTKLSSDTPGFFPDTIIYKELRIVGALGVSSPEYKLALDIISKGKYPFEEFPRKVEHLENASKLLASLAGETGEIPPVHGVLTP
jgi:alcohol dehydrogenase